MLLSRGFALNWFRLLHTHPGVQHVEVLRCMTGRAFDRYGLLVVLADRRSFLCAGVADLVATLRRAGEAANTARVAPRVAVGFGTDIVIRSEWPKTEPGQGEGR